MASNGWEGGGAERKRQSDGVHRPGEGLGREAQQTELGGGATGGAWDRTGGRRGKLSSRRDKLSSVVIVVIAWGPFPHPVPHGGSEQGTRAW